MKKKIFLFLLCIAFFHGITYAHDDLHKRILKTTNEIKKHPDSAFLYLKRGKLYYQHKSFKKSIIDLKRSKALGYISVEQNLLFANVYIELDSHNLALENLEFILSDQPKDVRALKIKGLLLFELGKFKQSAISFEKVIKYTNQCIPQNFIDASISWENTNTEYGNSQAIMILEKGKEILGNLISLNARLIKLSIYQNKYDYAIKLQQEIISNSSRKEVKYLELFKLYQTKGDKENAIKTLTLAKVAYQKLPTRIKNTSQMKTFYQTLLDIEKSLKLN